MQISYSPNNALITVSCRLRGGCERLLARSNLSNRAGVATVARSHLERDPTPVVLEPQEIESYGIRAYAELGISTYPEPTPFSYDLVTI
jgi:hypothetical protein